MTSFIAKTFNFISHQTETVVAVLATSRSLMNSSIVPVVLGDDALWRRLCSRTFSSPHFRTREGMEHHSPELQQDILRLFVNFCDTMQFTERLTFFPDLPKNFVDDVVLELSSTKRYFCRTLQHIDFIDQESIEFCCMGKFGNLRSFTLRDPSFVAKPINSRHLYMLCDSRNFPRLQEFGISSLLTRDITDEQWQVLSNATSLEILNLIGSTVTSLGFLKGLKRLKALSLACCHNLSVQSFTDLQIHHADANSGALLPCLESINLKENDFEITSSLLQILLDHAPVMQVLKCDASRSFEGAEIISEMRFLTKLSLDHCESLDEKCFEVLFSNLAHLENIRLEEAEQLNDACLLHLSQTRSPIKKLALSPCANVTNEGLGHLASLTFLEVFELDGGFYRDSINLTGEIGGEKHLARSLTKLTLYSCTYLTDAGLASTLKSLSCLRELYLNYVPEKVTSEGLKVALAGSGCQNTLEVLDLTQAEEMSDLRFVKGLKALKKLDFLGELDLNVMRCDSDEKGFGALSSCTCLKILHLGSNDLRDTDIVDDFPSNLFQSLEDFRVWSCQLTDFALIAGISKMKNLRELNISSRLNEEEGEENADPYTIAGVLHVVQHLPYLHRLEVRDDIAQDIRKDTGLVGKKVGPLFGNSGNGIDPYINY